ncbi:hypothetical protein MES4922_560002 [Mesorhizobium ventifaucium]|uniref:Uncharacterized protein n=1 Tax=Mesorhizobium ventifaucium TaxID=666020 RepID=A0ABN8K977_9HYPH|nr:hypothetical protein MES4922_560002 [Mesorhizobium ventifaucium]
MPADHRIKGTDGGAGGDCNVIDLFPRKTLRIGRHDAASSAPPQWARLDQRRAACWGGAREIWAALLVSIFALTCGRRAIGCWH